MTGTSVGVVGLLRADAGAMPMPGRAAALPVAVLGAGDAAAVAARSF